MQEREWELEGGSLKYKIQDGAVCIVEFHGQTAELTVPEQIEGLPVAVIGKKAFLSRKSLRLVRLPGTVREIGDWAFASCNSLKEIQLPRRELCFGKAVFLDCTRLERIVLYGEASPCGAGEPEGQGNTLQTAELLAAAVTDFGAYYLLEPPAVGSPEWLEKWDAKLAAVLHTPDEEGFSRQVLCGEEDYGSTDVLAYVSERRREKSRLAFLRLLYPWKLAEPQKCELAAYLTAHTKGGESEEAWQVILRERGNDRVYYSLFAELGCLNAENLCPVLEDIGEEFPEMKAYFLQRMAQAPAATDFFAGLEL